MICVILFSFVLLIQTVNAAHDGLILGIGQGRDRLHTQEDFLRVPAQHLKMAKDALPGRIEQIMQKEHLGSVSEQELQCIHDYLKNKKSKKYMQWVKDHDCCINCGLFSALALPQCLAALGTYLFAESVGLEVTENTLTCAGLAALPFGGCLSYGFAKYYQPDQSEISNQIEHVSQALANKQKRD